MKSKSYPISGLSPSSWQMVRGGDGRRAFDVDSPLGSMVEVHRVHIDDHVYPNPIPVYTPNQVAAMYGLHGGFVTK